MSTEHIFLAGTSIEYDKSLFMDSFQSGNAWLGFSRTEPLWGFSSLVKLRHTRSFPLDVMGQELTPNHDNPEAHSDEKFYDKNSIRLLQALEVPSGGDLIRIAYIDKNATKTVFANYHFLDTSDVGVITLDYMNEEWCRLRGMNTDYLRFTLENYSVETYDYYVFNYSQNIVSRTIIEAISDVSKSTITYPIRLMYSADQTSSIPTTSFGNNLVGDLTKSVNILGETEITGLKPEFVTDGNGYIQNNSMQNYGFFLATSEGVVLQDDMKFIRIINTDEEIAVLFSYPLVNEATQNSGRIKITISQNPKQLAIFNERFSDGESVNDITPPPLTVNYLKNGQIHYSVFDILGISKIAPGEVSFVRRIDTIHTEKVLFGVDPSDPEYDLYPGVPGISEFDITIITIQENPETTVKFAQTTDIDIARRYYFDLIKIEKTVTKNDANSPTDEVYRQLFICYKPKDKDGVVCSSEDVYTHDDLFDTSEHHINIGTLLFIANKQPIFRKYLEEDEEFTILV